MKDTALIAGLFLLVSVECFAKDPGTISDRELKVGGVALGDTERSVVARLGKPTRRIDTGEGIQLDYGGLTVWVGYLENAKPGVPRRVYELLSISKRYCTPSGVCPGVAFDKVRAKHGAPLVADRKDGQFMEYPSYQSQCWLQISVKAGIIQSVRAECQP